MSMFCEVFAHILAELISIEIMFCGIAILELNGIIWYCCCNSSLSDLLKPVSLNYLLTLCVKTTQKRWFLIVSPFSYNIFWQKHVLCNFDAHLTH